jgi:hypothetical protein
LGKNTERKGCDSSLLDMKCTVVIVRTLLMAHHNIIPGHLDPKTNILRSLFTLVVDVLYYRKAPNAEQ